MLPRSQIDRTRRRGIAPAPIKHHRISQRRPIRGAFSNMPLRSSAPPQRNISPSAQAPHEIPHPHPSQQIRTSPPISAFLPTPPRTSNESAVLRSAPRFRQRLFPQSPPTASFSPSLPHPAPSLLLEKVSSSFPVPFEPPVPCDTPAYLRKAPPSRSLSAPEPQISPLHPSSLAASPVAPRPSSLLGTPPPTHVAQSFARHRIHHHPAHRILRHRPLLIRLSLLLHSPAPFPPANSQPAVRLHTTPTPSPKQSSPLKHAQPVPPPYRIQPLPPSDVNSNLHVGSR